MLISAVAQAENDNIMSEYNAKNGAALSVLLMSRVSLFVNSTKKPMKPLVVVQQKFMLKLLSIHHWLAASMNQWLLHVRPLVNTSS